MHALLLRLIRESDRVPVEEAERSTYDPRLGKHKSGKHHECDHPDGWAEVPFPECLAHESKVGQRLGSDKVPTAA